MSDLRAALDEYLNIRRTLGFKLRDEGTALPQFLFFLEKKDGLFITIDLAVQWATLPENVLPAHWARRLTMVRNFAKFRSSVDPRTEIPPQGLLPFRYHRKPPYIYDDGEIKRLLKASNLLRSVIGLRASTYCTLLGLLTVTGMRVSEVIALNRRDVDLLRGVLTVRLTKFGKSRLIPIHSSTVEQLSKYSHLRDQLFSSLT